MTQFKPSRGRRSILCAFLLSGGCLLTTNARAEDALELAKRVDARPSGRDVTSISRMVLTEKGRAPRTRELMSYRLDRGRGETATLIRFLEPPDIAGTGLLSIDRSDSSNEQSLYLPELDRVRRISGDRKGGRFVGSDLYFEDLQARLPAKDQHRLLGKETVDGVVCEVLESTPRDPSDSVYRKRISWIDPQTLLAHRVDYFERDDTTPTKRWVQLAKKRVQGYWTVTDSRVTDLSSGHETRMIVEEVLFDRKLPTRLFTPRALADESIESEFRP